MSLRAIEGPSSSNIIPHEIRVLRIATRVKVLPVEAPTFYRPKSKIAQMLLHLLMFNMFLYGPVS